MAIISINLLPIEFRDQEIKEAKFYKIQTLGIAFILLMIFGSFLTVAIRYIQSQKINQAQEKLNQAEQRVSDLKDTQASLVLLKNRLLAISQYLGSPSKQTQSYETVQNAVPDPVSISSISVNNSAEVLLSAQTPDGLMMDNVITNLTTQDTIQNNIKQVSLESAVRGADGIYKLSLKASPN